MLYYWVQQQIIVLVLISFLSSSSFSASTSGTSVWFRKNTSLCLTLNLVKQLMHNIFVFVQQQSVKRSGLYTHVEEEREDIYLFCCFYIHVYTFSYSTCFNIFLMIWPICMYVCMYACVCVCVCVYVWPRGRGRPPRPPHKVGWSLLYRFAVSVC